MRLRLRGPGGAANCLFDEQATVQDLIAEAVKVAQSEYCTVLSGFPPTPLSLKPSAKLADIVRNGDTLTVQPSTSSVSQPASVSLPAPEPISPPAAAFPSTTADAATSPVHDEDEDLRLALALSRGEDITSASGPASQGPTPQSYAPLQPGGEERMVRRVIPADNSCLFAAVAYALEGGAGCVAAKKRELREHVAAVVRACIVSGDERFGEAMLGRPPLEYASWIGDEDHWGGATELDILSERYATELAAIDVKTGRADIFGQGRGYTQRALLLYDGIHYDILVRTLFSGAPAELDVTVFPVGDELAVAQAQAVAAEVCAARDFTDTASFTIRCLVCQKGLKGEAEAVEHAKATSHTNFSEYR